MAYDYLLHDLPRISITNVTSTGFTVNMTIHTDGIFEAPSNFSLHVWNSTQGSSKKTEDIYNLKLSDFPHNITGFKGGEHIFCYVMAYWDDDTDRTSTIEIFDTPYIPITKIEFIDDSGNAITKTEVINGGLNYIFSVGRGNLKITPSNASVLDGNRQRVIYSLDSLSFADVDNDGVIRGKKRGFARLSVKPADNINTNTAQFNGDVEVIQLVEGITFDRENITLGVGDTAELSVIVIPDNANNQNVTYSIPTSEQNIATVSGNIVTAKSVGSTTVTATAEDNLQGLKTATMLINVQSSSVQWNEIKSCPKILNANDFNIISQNARYIYVKSEMTAQLAFPTVSMKNDSLVVAKAIKALFKSIETMCKTLNEPITEIADTMIYAPSQSEWNTVITALNNLKTRYP